MIADTPPINIQSKPGTTMEMGYTSKPLALPQIKHCRKYKQIYWPNKALRLAGIKEPYSITTYICTKDVKLPS